jgi:hypothetical protein
MGMQAGKAENLKETGCSNEDVGKVKSPRCPDPIGVNSTGTRGTRSVPSKQASLDQNEW